MRAIIYRRSISLLLALLVAGCYVHNPSWRTPAGHQRAAARSFWPVDPEIPGRPHRRAEVFVMRVYADQEYRQRPHWKDHALGLVRRANAYLGPAFGVTFKPSLIEWERQGAAADLSVVMAELATLDDGTDADWVVGLTGAPAAFTASHHELGQAELLGKHFVMRDLNDATEARKLDEWFDELDGDERLALYGARREHKALAVFLHEWAHTLGAIHERGDGRIMFPSYDATSSTFSEASVGVIERGLAIRRIDGADEAAVAARADATGKLLAYVQATAHEEWWADERQELVARLGGGTADDGARAGAAGGGEAGVIVPTGARAGYNRAVDLANAGDVAGAWGELEAVVGAYPDALPVQRLGCTLAARGEPSEASLKACGRAAVLAPTDASVPLLEAEAWQHRGKPAEAMAALERARQRLLVTSDARLWYQLAAMYLDAGALTRAAEAGARAGGHDGAAIERMVRERRRLAGLPVDGARVGVPVDAEPAYWVEFWKAYKLFMGDPKLARRTVEDALARYPKAPGLLALACGVDAETGKLAAARKRCAAALAGDDESVIAHFFAAQLATDPAVAVVHYEKVVALDPAQRSSWEALGRLYPKVGRHADRERLAREYQRQFGVSLP